MSASFTPRRRAEDFAALLEGDGRLNAEAGQRHASLLAVVAELRSVPQPTPRPDFVAGLREQLMAEAETALAPDGRLGAPSARTTTQAPVRDPRRVRRDRRVAALLGTAALVGGTGSVAMASQAALPGEVLYPIKQALESAHSGVTTGDRDEGLLLLSRAEQRLDEVETLAQRDDAGSRRATPGTLDAFTSQALAGADRLVADHEANGRESSMTTLRDFAGEGLVRLEVLSAQVPDEAADELVAAAEALLDIDARARRACPECGDPGLTELPRFLASGEVLDPSSAETRASARASTRVTSQGPGQGGTQGPKRGKGPGPTMTGQPPATPLPPGPTVPGSPKAPLPTVPATPKVPLPSVPVPTPTGPVTPRAPGPVPPTRSTVIDKVTETLLGSPTPTDGATPTPGIVGGLNETLGGITETLLGKPAGETVEQTAEGLRKLLGGVLGQRPDQGLAED